MPEQKLPRQTGSMVAHHDDIVTRMKNVEMIEIGPHRIRPWYFSPYPQVNHLQYVQCAAKKVSPKVICHFLSNHLEFLREILQVYYLFIYT